MDGTGSLEVADSGNFFVDAFIAPTVGLEFAASGGAFVVADPAHAGGTFTQFGAGDIIDLTIQGYTGGTPTYSNGQLSIPTANGNIALNVDFAPGYSVASVRLADDGAGGTFAYMACFAEGTRIETEQGMVAVETLGPGDRAVLAGGGTRPVVWTGHRRIDCARHPRPHDVMPVRVRADAFAPGAPCRDLLLSPDHALLFEGVLIPVRDLANGSTIAQESVAVVTYWHVELDRHDVLLAEGLPAESYLDTGNRHAFANAAVAAPVPDFRRAAVENWDREACAPLVREGLVVESARGVLKRRAGEPGDVFAWTGREPHVRLSSPAVFARIHEGGAGNIL